MSLVHGLNHFSKYFETEIDSFVIIGGVAGSVMMLEEGAEFRQTKDIDLVIIAHPSQNFTSKLKKYIKDGEYEIKEKQPGRPCFFRFSKPNKKDFPLQIEIFAKNENDLKLKIDQHVIPIKTKESAGRLSAILLEEEYFNLVKENRIIVKNHSIINLTANIVLKARAYNDLLERKTKGEKVDTQDIKKHRNDILRFATTLDRTKKCKLKPSIRDHMTRCLKDLSELSEREVRDILGKTSNYKKHDLLTRLSDCYL